ncbi:anti-sigma-I factor RsgI family protein [Clostridium polynesiense]|uniref:anti-sigma-I factor RsgI family protein n=1 Tax=Clostridium polynesiense TaxID=1325933 RepID=UPI00058D71DA|nr:hypothetical protein [Clostridium polynesiense]
MDGIKAMTKKYFTFLLTCALSLMLLLGGVTVQAIPKNYVAIDINPSIELVTNQYDNVVSVNAVNKDAEKLISDLEIIGLKIKDAVKQIVEKSVEFGYIKADKANEILITGSISNKSKDILEKVDESVKETLEANKVHSEVVKQNIDVNDRLLQEAHENGVSAGKYSVIEKLVKGNSYISKEELAEVKIASLFAYAKENNIT